MTCWCVAPNSRWVHTSKHENGLRKNTMYVLFIVYGPGRNHVYIRMYAYVVIARGINKLLYFFVDCPAGLVWHFLFMLMFGFCGWYLVWSKAVVATLVQNGVFEGLRLLSHPAALRNYWNIGLCVCFSIGTNQDLSKFDGLLITAPAIFLSWAASTYFGVKIDSICLFSGSRFSSRWN